MPARAPVSSTGGSPLFPTTPDNARRAPRSLRRAFPPSPPPLLPLQGPAPRPPVADGELGEARDADHAGLVMIDHELDALPPGPLAREARDVVDRLPFPRVRAPREVPRHRRI